MIIKDMKLSDIVPYENNPRQNANAIEAVAESIKAFGFKVPMVLDKNNVIITGHTRYEAAKQIGLKKVPVVIADWMDDEKVKAYRLADNKVAEFSTWDWDALQAELDEIAGIDMDIFGFTKIDQADLMPKQAMEDDGSTRAKECQCPRCGRRFKV